MGAGARLDLERFVAECRGSLDASDVLEALASSVSRVVADRPRWLASLGDGPGLRVTQIVAEPALTVMHLASPPGFAFPPHDHRMPSVVAVLSGIEQNVYYARRGEGLVEIGRRRVLPGEVVAHDERVIHEIANGSEQPLAALHVYAGDFLGLERSEWRGDPLREHPYDVARLRTLIVPM